jgi:hypothetical protein
MPEETEPICSYYPNEFPATFGNASLVVVSDNCPESSEIIASKSNGEMLGKGVFHNGRAALTIACADQFTGRFATNGDNIILTAYNALARSEQSMTIETAADVLNNETASQLTFKQNGVFVVKARIDGYANASIDMNCYPNPVAGISTVEFVCPESGLVEISLIALNGEKVASLFNGDVQSMSRNTASLDASQIANGVYTLVMKSASGSIAKQIVVAK